MGGKDMENLKMEKQDVLLHTQPWGNWKMEYVCKNT